MKILIINVLVFYLLVADFAVEEKLDFASYFLKNKYSCLIILVCMPFLS